MSFCRRLTRPSGNSTVSTRGTNQRRIQKFIETRLQTDNDPHGQGEGYTGPLKGYWKYRIGDYRLVRDIQEQSRTILVVAIGDRKDVYR